MSRSAQTLTTERTQVEVSAYLIESNLFIKASFSLSWSCKNLYEKTSRPR